MAKNYVTVNKEMLESCICIVKSSPSPIYLYQDGKKTEKIDGYKVPVMVFQGHDSIIGEDLVLRSVSKPTLPVMSMIRFSVNDDYTKVYANNQGIQVSLWVNEIRKVEQK
ncbi:hypothetical protein [Streptococcus suis]|uniref:hypothetical protein n=1 Tax=Streptococcus suis TaxID=1307 RepID=UPI000CF737DB